MVFVLSSVSYTIFKLLKGLFIDVTESRKKGGSIIVDGYFFLQEIFKVATKK